jgi:hypothetical protein
LGESSFDNFEKYYVNGRALSSNIQSIILDNPTIVEILLKAIIIKVFNIKKNTTPLF